jgi:hypothetical protein
VRKPKTYQDPGPMGPMAFKGTGPLGSVTFYNLLEQLVAQNVTLIDLQREANQLKRWELKLPPYDKET